MFVELTPGRFVPTVSVLDIRAVDELVIVRLAGEEVRLAGDDGARVLAQVTGVIRRPKAKPLSPPTMVETASDLPGALVAPTETAAAPPAEAAPKKKSRTRKAKAETASETPAEPVAAE